MPLIDLTHTLSPSIPSWDGSCCFSLGTKIDYGDCTQPNLFRVQTIDMFAGVGTHIDAPAHCFPGAATVDKLELKTLKTNCVVIRIDDATDENTVIAPDVIHAFEKKHGTIPSQAFVLFHTGWDKHWQNPKKYRNDLQFPSVRKETATLLVSRDIAGIGIDTLSPDAGGKDFPVHRILLGAGKYIVENVANAGSLPPTGARISIMPMKIGNGTEAPIRLSATFD